MASADPSMVGQILGQQTVSGPKGYWSTRLTLGDGVTTEAVLAVLKPYYERAHQGARDRFHAGEPYMRLLTEHAQRQPVQYPNDLPAVDRSTRFGEVLCGLVAEWRLLHGQVPWTIPVFLYRTDDRARHALTLVATGHPPPGPSPRSGDDCLGLLLDPDDGALSAILVAEAKCRKRFEPAKVREELLALRDKQARDLSALHEILQSEASTAEQIAAWLALEQRILEGNTHRLSRYDLYLCVFESLCAGQTHPIMGPTDAQGSTQDPKWWPYSRPLHVVEVHLRDRLPLIKQLYDCLYTGDGHD